MNALSCTAAPTATAAPIEKASPIETASPQRPNWIAGAVIGPVFLLILAATVLYLSRKKSQRAKQMPQEGVIETKAQLHGDDIKPVGPVLLENTEVTELPANELVGSELNAV
ncbi:MAG: hypothetical protein M1840_003795 [Geoglossum simile]|nr:MAG: hypothetical protein M1840_003795 [Geoglossum simile]